MLILVYGLVWSSHGICAQGSSSSLDELRAPPIEIAEAQVSFVQNTFVAAPIAGVVSNVFVSEGEHVVDGDELLRFDFEQAQTELEAARAAFEAARLVSENDVDARYAKRSLEVHQRELEQSLLANERFSGSVSQTEIAKLRLVVDQSRLAIEKAEHERAIAQAKSREKLAAAKIAESRLGKHRVKSTVSGYVVEVAVEPGEWTDAGEPVVRVISLDPVRVECFIDGKKHGSELVGEKIQFIVRSADGRELKPLTGEVTFVSPELHPVTGQSRLWATVQNPELAARAGMSGRLIIQPTSLHP